MSEVEVVEVEVVGEDAIEAVVAEQRISAIAGDPLPGEAERSEGERAEAAGVASPQASVETPAVTEPAGPVEDAAASGEGGPSSDSASIERLIGRLRADNADAVSVLIGGTSVDEVLASLDVAKAEYQRVADQVRSSTGVEPVRVPSGVTQGVDMSTLSGVELIKAAIAAGRRM